MTVPQISHFYNLMVNIFFERVTALKIIHYPHRTLRHKSKPIKRVDRELKQTVEQMFELMYEARGIGLAANQVDLPLQMFVINLSGDPDSGEEMVFVNPVIDSPKGTAEAEEGCLSIPGINGIVARPSSIHVSAYDLSGNEIDMIAEGLLARAIQHEYDHLQGVLFIDRISDSAKKQIEDELNAFELEYKGQQAAQIVGDRNAIDRRLKEIEAKYC